MSENNTGPDEQPTTPTAKRKFNLGAMVMGWWNEGEEKPRHTVVDMVSLSDLADREEWTKEEFENRLQGFVDGLSILGKNYNIFPKQAPISEEDWVNLQNIVTDAFLESKQARENSDTTTDVTTNPST